MFGKSACQLCIEYEPKLTFGCRSCKILLFWFNWQKIRYRLHMFFSTSNMASSMFATNLGQWNIANLIVDASVHIDRNQGRQMADSCKEMYGERKKIGNIVISSWAFSPVLILFVVQKQCFTGQKLGSRLLNFLIVILNWNTYVCSCKSFDPMIFILKVGIVSFIDDVNTPQVVKCYSEQLALAIPANIRNLKDFVDEQHASNGT